MTPMPLPNPTDWLSVCVFCGAQNKVDAAHLEVGERIGTRIAREGYRMVFGGGNCGMMGKTSTAAMQAGGEVIGVFPHHLKDHEIEHTGITQTIIVGSMHERKKLMFDLSDVFAILPGGFGTMDEMFEILTWRQIGLHEKPVVIFNHMGYWNPLLEMMEHLMDHGFAPSGNRQFYAVANTEEELFSLLKQSAEKKAAKNA